MAKKCLVWGCKNEPDDIYHKLSKPRYEKWMIALGRNPKENLSYENAICSKHFSYTDYIISMKGNKILKADAIPSLNLKKSLCLNEPVASTSATTFLSRQYTVLPKRRRLNIDFEGTTASIEESSKLMQTASNVSIDEVALKESSGDKSPSKLSCSSTDSEHLKGSPKRRRKYAKIMHNYAASPTKINKSFEKEKQKTSKLRIKIKSMKEQKIRLKKKVINLRSIVINLKRKSMINEDVEKILEKTFTGIPLALMKRMLTNAKRGKITREKYPETLRSFAMTLQFYSSKGYNYVRKVFDLALPSPSVIRSWMTNVDCEPGFTEQSFVAIKRKVEENEILGHKTICSLMLDEISIRKQIDFAKNKTWGYVNLGTDINNDELDEAREALVLMVVAANGYWKIPIAYFLIKSLTAADKANIIKQALIKLKETSVIITSITCDGPNVNFAMMQNLGAKIENLNEPFLQVYFHHPEDSSKVFIIFDVCHMIKILRNNWATIQILKDPNEDLVNFAYIEYLYNLQEQEHLRFGTKLKKAHMEWKKQKMKVNLAVQLFSRSVADALEFLMIDMKHPLFNGAAATIKFIRLVDSLFDLLNSRSIIGKGYKIPIRIENKNIWIPVFKDALHFFSNCKTINNVLLTDTRKKTPFKGFIITINSVLGLYEMYIESNYLKYLLTYKFSQDHLELFFCSVRSRNGWNNNPSALQFYYTYKRLLLHHDIKNMSGNCIGQDSTNVLYTTASKKVSFQ